MDAIPIEENELILSIFLLILTGLCIAIRFSMRAKSKVSFGSDDWWILASTVSFYINNALQIWGVWQSNKQFDLAAKIEQSCSDHTLIRLYHCS